MPADLFQARDRFKAACGHGAMAAALETSVAHVCEEYLTQPGPVSLTQMRGAMMKAGVLLPAKNMQHWRKGVALIQWIGSWPPKFDCHHRHWIAWRALMAGRYAGEIGVWDVNEPDRWLEEDDWRERLAPQLFPSRGTGFSVEFLEMRRLS